MPSFNIGTQCTFVSEITDRIECILSDATDSSLSASYFNKAQIQALRKKNPYLKSNEDLSVAAVKKFFSSESKCRSTNESLNLGFRGLPRDLADILYTAKHYVKIILKDLVYGPLDFGPGSTLSLDARSSDLITKLGTFPDCTLLASRDVLYHVLDKLPHYAISSGLVSRDRTSVTLNRFNLVYSPGNRFTTVPKDSRSHRGICIEPMGNMLIQKSLGSSIRSRLRDFGFDLNFLQEKHGEYARLGSLDGSIATLDLESASDTISHELVRLLLPPDWFDALYNVRCQRTDIGGSLHWNEKFSSMGNGYTFELETLIFLSILLSCRELYGQGDELVSCYGDDIAISHNLVSSVMYALNGAGFIVNPEKSFWRGPFRESCGQDFFLGFPVRPTYLKDLPNDRILFFVSLANRISAIKHHYRYDSAVFSRLNSVWDYVISRIPSNLRWFGPASFGDSVIISEGCWTQRFRHQCRQVKCYARISRGKRLPDCPDWRLTCALAGISSAGLKRQHEKYVIRGRYLSTVEKPQPGA